MNEHILPMRAYFPLESVEEMWSKILARNAGVQEFVPTMNCPETIGLIVLPAGGPELGKIMYRADFREMEFNFRGEQRHFILSQSIEACPHCRGTPMMKSEPLAVYSFGAKMGFAIFCPTCGNTTPFFKSSEAAIRHWTLTAKLTK